MENTNMSASENFTLLSQSGRFEVELDNTNHIPPFEVEFIGLRTRYTAGSTISFMIKLTNDLEETDVLGLGHIPINVQELDSLIYPFESTTVKKIEKNLYGIAFKETNFVPIESSPYAFCLFKKGMPSMIATSDWFTFEKPDQGESTPADWFPDLIEVEDPHDPGLVVFKSRNDHSVLDLQDSCLQFASAESTLEQNLCSKTSSLKLTEEEKQCEPEDHSFCSENPTGGQKDESSVCLEVPTVNELNIPSSHCSPEAAHSALAQSERSDSEDKLKRVLEELEVIKATIGSLKASQEKKDQENNYSSDAVYIKRSPMNLKSLCSSKLRLQKINENEALLAKCKAFQMSHSSLSNDNEVLKDKLAELEELNSFLKSRISVLELELKNINKNQYDILVKCFEELEHENMQLKREIDRRSKAQCEIFSLENEIKNLKEENEDLKQFIRNHSFSPKTVNDKDALESIVFQQYERYFSKCQILQKELDDIKKELGHCQKSLSLNEATKHDSQTNDTGSAFGHGHSNFGHGLQFSHNYSEAENSDDDTANGKKNPLKPRHSPDSKDCAAIKKTFSGDILKLKEENEYLKSQLMALRKQAVGKVSLNLLPTN